MGKKYFIISVLLAGILVASGCQRKSIEDVKKFEETSAEVASKTSGEKVYYNKHDDIFNTDSLSNSGSVGAKAKYAGENDVYQIVESVRGTDIELSVKVRDVRAEDDISGFSKIMEQAEIERYIDYETNAIKDSMRNLNSDKTIKKDKMGIEQIALLVKLDITNNSSIDFDFNSVQFRIYYFKDNDGIKYYAKISDGFSYIDKHDTIAGEEYRGNHLKIKAGETKEIVMIDYIPKELVTAYTEIRTVYGKGSVNSEYTDITIAGSTLDSLYMSYQDSSKNYPFSEGSTIVKLEIDK